MTDKTLRILAPVLVLALVAALVIQGFAGRQRREDICARENAALTVLHDVIVLAMTPPPGKRLSPAQVKAITAFEAKAFARIDSARC